MTSPALFRSAGVRLALAYAGLFALSALVLILYLWWATAGLLNRQVEAAVRADAQGLAERYQQGGLLALRRTIDDRLAENVDDDAIYLLADTQMNRITGNLAEWPVAVARPETWYELEVVRDGMRSPARMQDYALEGGFSLIVGRDVRARVTLRDLLTGTLVSALAVVAALGVLGAVAVQRVFQRMLSRVSMTADAVAAGDLAQRVRVSGRGDEIDRVAEAINDMLDRIGRLMDGVRTVSDSIAHDLRTPIARARARLEDAAHGTDPEALRTACWHAIADLDGISAVFRALLRIAEIEAGGRRSAFAPFDAAEVLAGLAELYGAAAEEAGLDLTLDAPAPLILSGDRAMVQQAVANLLDNALKFSPSGGTVRLTGSATPGTVQIAVADSGPGIAPADRARATERFFSRRRRPPHGRLRPRPRLGPRGRPTPRRHPHLGRRVARRRRHHRPASLIRRSSSASLADRAG